MMQLLGLFDMCAGAFLMWFAWAVWPDWIALAPGFIGLWAFAAGMRLLKFPF